ncbi:MAG: c-type cytochrome [Gammaproteobacteria bacterium]|nr:c-type cytochrome [Gammaproteobacteria bacterium]MBU1979869.1 c-type cytochrome [Gammaproteobacteria bacterium]
MSHQARTKNLLCILSAAIVLAFSANAVADDDEGAAEFKKLLKKNDCLKCHAFDKTKKGPSYKKIAAKYKGKEAEGEVKMYKNITLGQKVKLEDGKEEEHKIIDAKDEKEFKALIKWILTL